MSTNSRELFEALMRGHELQQAGQIGRAESIYRDVLRRSPGHPDALYLLATVAQSVGRHEDAIRLNENACIANPTNPNYYVGLGYSLEALERWDEAIAAYRRAIEIHAGVPEAYNNLGNVLHTLGRTDEAEAAYREAIAIHPGYVEAHIHLGHVLKVKGETWAAAQAYRRTLELDPTRLEVYRALCYVKRFESGDDADLLAMESALRRTDLPSVNAMHLHFALGKARHELGQHEAAFGHWRQANTLLRRSYAYDVEEEVELARRIKAYFTPELLAARTGGCGRADARPIFIVGMPRSGSSLVEQIVASHPDVAGAGELTEMRRAIHRFGDFPVGDKGYPAAAIDAAADEYLRRIRLFNPDGRPRVTDKTLFNFFYIGMIRLMFPQAAVVCCWRDPLDVGLSCYRHYFPDIRRFAYDLRELGCFYGVFADLMSYWHETIPGFVHDVFYEDLVESPEAEIGRLLEHCGLDWSDLCLRFHENRRAVKTASTTQVRQPINRAGMGQWRPYARHLGPLRAGLGEIQQVLPPRYRAAVEAAAGDGVP